MINKTTTQYMPTNEKFPTWEHFIPNVGTFHSQRGNNPFLSWELLQTLCLLFLMLVLGTGKTWGQTGIWYIANSNNNSGTGYTPPVYSQDTPETNWYLVPAKDPQQNDYRDTYYSPDHTNQNGDPEKPFLTTHYITKNDINKEYLDAIWIIIPSGENNYYFIIHAKTGKYVIYEPPLPNDGNRRKAMHLQTPDDGDYNPNSSNSTVKNKFKFRIAANGTGYNIDPRNRSGYYWNTTGQNANNYYGTDNNDGKNLYHLGLVGVYNNSGGNSVWYTESGLLPAPTINYSQEGNDFSVTIADSNGLPAGYDILYTTNGDTPTIGGATTSTYTSAVTITEDCTVKAVVARYGIILTEVATIFVGRPNVPTITPPSDCNNMIEISAADGTSIYYTLDGTTPNKNSTLYTGPFVQNNVATIKAVVYDGNIHSNIETYNFTSPYTVKPTITQSGTTVTITGTGTIYYTINGGDPDTGSTQYEGPITLTGSSGETKTVRAVAKDGSKGLSCVAEKTVAMAYYINDLTSLEAISSHPGDLCILTEDIDASGLSSSISGFAGEFDGDFHTISGLTKPLFNDVNGATIKNVILDNINISSSGNVGAICNEASGYTRIYNCGILPNDATNSSPSTVASTDGYCGGLVGWLKDDSRVINCFSYANITGGTDVAGIVGHNEVASTTEVTDGKYANLRTAVVNCMFYGNIISGTNRYPVYGGAKIVNNTATGINNYDFYRAEASVGTLADYNCSWPAKEEYLTQYEFYRNLLNSNRELCGWWVGAAAAPSTMTTSDVQDVPKDASLMAKWVYAPDEAPYPILKPFGKYSSSINIDADASWRTTANEWEGKKLGTLKVTINPGTYAAGGASTKNNVDFTITDMDTLRADYCYRKIQLPYYNTVFGNPNGNTWAAKYGGNYGDYVVIGWKVSTSEGTVGEFTENWETGYNFADRNCTAKDADRIFAQGGYYYVPNGVENITITAQWANAIYLDNTDHDYDRISVSSFTVSNGVYVGTSTFQPFAPAGKRSAIGNGKTVKNGTISSNVPSSSNVYGNAIVLVGNHQEFAGNSNIGSSSKACTIMSADLDFDDEPDNCLIWQLGKNVARQSFCPIRFDFLPVVEMGLAMKEDGSTQFYSFGCFRPLGHFEVTETSLIHFGQFEFSNKSRNATAVAPIILNGGIFDQYTKGTKNNAFDTATDPINYIIIGGNVRIPSFTPGAHVNSSANFPTRHCAVNVIGGNIDNLYLTGNYNDGVTPNPDNPHCYIDGGRLKHVAAAGKEGIDGDVYFEINHSKIWEFYGGSTLADKRITGNINVTIDNSLVDKYCGGPKFGDTYHENNKTVTTNATNTTFGVYYGGGNGGTSYVQYDKSDGEQTVSSTFNWGTIGKTDNYTAGKYRNKATGYMADYDMEIVNLSTGTNKNRAVYRTYFYSAQFSATNTGSITNHLTNCTVLTNFYGGGNLGGVKGNVTSTLDGETHVYGSAFGAGFSASVPSVTIHNKDKVAPTIDVNTGIITPESGGSSTTYTWTNKTSFGETTLSVNNPTIENVEGINYFYTEESLDNLGAVSGTVTLKVEGTTTVEGSVYGGGEESGVDGSTTVSVSGGTIGAEGQGGVEFGNVYGGGKGKDDSVEAGLVKGTTTVTISGSPRIYHNIYGGGAYGSVGEFTYDANGMPTARKENTTGGVCNVTITGGTIGWNGKENGMVFGSSRGDVGEPGGITDKQAWVYDTHVIIGSDTGPLIKGSVYGGGENGHVFHDASVTINKGTIGITDPQIDGGARYAYRGNVYGGGCGTDTYTVDGKTYFNRLAGIVQGNATVNITDGHVVHNVYGGGAMGSVGVFAREASDNIHMPGKITGLTSGGTCTVTISGGKVGNIGTKMYYEESGVGPDDFGHVFGGGRGEVHDLADYPNLERVIYVNNTSVAISNNAFVTGSVYGGSESGHVLGNTNVSVSGGQIGCGEEATGPYTTWDESVKPTAHWSYTANGSPYDQYANAQGKYPDESTSEGGKPKATDGHTFFGNVFGGGSGYYPYAPGKWLRSAGQVEGTATVNISGGHILNNVYGGCEMADIAGAITVSMSGGTVGVPRSKTEIEALPTLGHIYGAGMGDKRIFFNTSTNVGSTTVSVSGGTVYGNVYGGGEDGHVMGNAVVTISQDDDDTPTVIGSVGNGGLDGNVFGGGQGSPTALTAGVVGGSVSLSIEGGHMLGSVYGGGRIASVGTFFAMATDPRYGKMQDDVDDDEATTEIDESVTHGHLTVNLLGGTIEQNVYGGCMGTNAAANADAEAIAFAAKLGMSKTVTVNLNQGVADNAKGCAVIGDIFGCNNTNASPQQAVTVHIYGTQNADKTQIANTAASGNTPAVTNAKQKGDYDVRAVYGGGNLAAYTPVGPNPTSTSDDGKNTTYSTNVIIDGCGRTSIQTVYGGGNAASTPATSLTVNGTYEIEEVFGGGNGKDAIDENTPNPGANVGFYDYSAVEETYPTKEERQTDDFTSEYVYGSGKASVNIFGGTVHRVFGGSNTKGNVRQTAVTMLDENSGCDFCVDEAYGGGKEAPMDAEAKLLMACIPGLSAAYGGAEAADIQGNVILNITNGTFNRVFGGNNLSGTISGTLTVNIEEVGCKPIIIGELYGGGNQAGYSIYGYDSDKQPKETGTRLFNDPQVNVKSFTSIGDIYGGGYGETAKMVGNPTVNINVVEGDWKDYVGDSNRYNEEGYMYNATGYKGETLTIEDTDGTTITTHDVDVPSHAKGKIGAINNVFGGGNAAKVIGNTNVNIGTLAEVYVVKVVGDGVDLTGQHLYTRSGAGTTASPYQYTEVTTGTADPDETYYEKKTVIGADIRNNVYGGGNNAEVTGKTNVQIGKNVTE